MSVLSSLAADGEQWIQLSSWAASRGIAPKRALSGALNTQEAEFAPQQQEDQQHDEDGHPCEVCVRRSKLGHGRQ